MGDYNLSADRNEKLYRIVEKKVTLFYVGMVIRPPHVIVTDSVDVSHVLDPRRNPFEIQ